MYIKSLKLQNFRNYADESFAFDPAVNLICGENGQGKTCLLYTSSMRSRVVPGISVTIARSRPSSVFSSVDLPAFGLPRITHGTPCLLYTSS